MLVTSPICPLSSHRQRVIVTQHSCTSTNLTQLRVVTFPRFDWGTYINLRNSLQLDATAQSPIRQTTAIVPSFPPDGYRTMQLLSSFFVPEWEWIALRHDSPWPLLSRRFQTVTRARHPIIDDVRAVGAFAALCVYLAH